MKRLTVSLCLALGLAAALQGQPAAQSEKAADIRKLIELTGGAKIMDQMFSAMAANFKDPKQQRILQEFRKELDPREIYDMMVPAYEKFLSGADIKEILRFYESPAGRRFLDAQPKIMTEIMPGVLQWSQQISARLMQKLKEQEGK